MRSKRHIQEAPVIDQHYINNIYMKIVDKMQVLDKLNNQYKEKQEGHFLKTFMNVIQKMGNQLILAQQAYKTVDLEARKDDYCLLLANELNFFKQQTYTLRELLDSKEKEANDLKIMNSTLQSELKSISQGYDMKIKQCMKIKSQIRQLKKQIKYLSDPTKNSIFKFTNPQTVKHIDFSENNRKKSSSLANYLQDASLQLYKVGNRIAKTNNHNRRKNNSVTIDTKIPQPHHQTSKTPIHQILPFYQAKSNLKNVGSTHSSFRKKLFNVPANRTLLQAYQVVINE